MTMLDSYNLFFLAVPSIISDSLPFTFLPDSHQHNSGDLPEDTPSSTTSSTVAAVDDAFFFF